MATRFRTADSSFDIGYGVAFELNGYKYPANWLKYATTQEITDIGLIAYTPTPDPTPDPPTPVEDHPRDYPLTKKQLLYALGEMDIFIGEIESLINAYVTSTGNARLKNRIRIEWTTPHRMEWDNAILQGLMQALAANHPELTLDDFKAAWLAAKDID